MPIKTIHVNLLLQLVRALHTLQLTHHSRLSRQKLNLRNQDPTVRKGCSLRSLPIFGWKSYTPFSGFNFKHVESYSSQLSIKCIYLQSYSKVEEWWRLLLVNPPISTDVPPKHWHHVTTPSSWVPWCKGTILRSNQSKWLLTCWASLLIWLVLGMPANQLLQKLRSICIMNQAEPGFCLPAYLWPTTVGKSSMSS